MCVGGLGVCFWGVFGGLLGVCAWGMLEEGVFRVVNLGVCAWGTWGMLGACA